MSSWDQLRMCCGYFCGLTACVGIYFFIVILIFETMNNVYLTETLQGISNPLDEPDQVKTFVMSFGICSALNLVCCLACCGCTICMKTTEDDIEEEEDDADFKNIQPMAQSINRD